MAAKRICFIFRYTLRIRYLLTVTNMHQILRNECVEQFINFFFVGVGRINASEGSNADLTLGYKLELVLPVQVLCLRR